MSSAVGPFALDEGLVPHVAPAADGEVTVRSFNTNTSKIIHSRFKATQGSYDPVGEYSIDGVPVRPAILYSTLSSILLVRRPEGALPTGNAVDSLDLPDGSRINASLIDIANPGVVVLSADVGVPADIAPDFLGADLAIMQRLEAIRQAGASKMGLDPATQTVHKVVLISAPAADVRGVHTRCRALSMQQAHKAVPLTLALTLGAACRLRGTLPQQTAVGAAGTRSIVIEHAGGKIEVGSVINEGKIESVLLHRTASVMMKGKVV